MSTKQDINVLRDYIKKTELQLQGAKDNLTSIEANCRHSWTEARYTPEYKESYTIPGDAPGTMGIDWRGPTHVPSKTIDKWTRECERCGKVEITTSTTEVKTKKPLF